MYEIIMTWTKSCQHCDFTSWFYQTRESKYA